MNAHNQATDESLEGTAYVCLRLLVTFNDKVCPPTTKHSSHFTSQIKVSLVSFYFRSDLPPQRFSFRTEAQWLEVGQYQVLVALSCSPWCPRLDFTTNTSCSYLDCPNSLINYYDLWLSGNIVFHRTNMIKHQVLGIPTYENGEDGKTTKTFEALTPNSCWRMLSNNISSDHHFRILRIH